MDDELEFEPPKKKKKYYKPRKRLYEEPMDDDQLISHFKYDHGIEDHYDE